MAATIDHVSGGRLEFGYGAAWYELEHEQYGIPFPRIGVRMDMLDEACRIVRSLWTEKRTTFEGQHYQLRDAMCEPKPLQEHLTLIIGGSGERRTLRIAAEHGDGWNTLYMPFDQYRHKLEVLDRHCADVGRDRGEIRQQLAVPMVLGDDEAEAQERLEELAARMHANIDEVRSLFLVATPEQFVETLQPYVELGVRDILMMARPPGDRRTIELFAKRVAPELRERARAIA
jgi:alkanesulfonate monooxygenase SsuD/methylene tetrahydromethanopterin reductase-like flavin-dependent oxidoreductase (luciferase family)